MTLSVAVALGPEGVGAVAKSPASLGVVVAVPALVSGGIWMTMGEGDAGDARDKAEQLRPGDRFAEQFEGRFGQHD
jgi:hypothetical protein